MINSDFLSYLSNFMSHRPGLSDLHLLTSAECIFLLPTDNNDRREQNTYSIGNKTHDSFLNIWPIFSFENLTENYC